MTKETYAIEWNGDHWQSVFPSADSHLSQNHNTIQDAYDYMTVENGVYDDITIIGG